MFTRKTRILKINRHTFYISSTIFSSFSFLKMCIGTSISLFFFSFISRIVLRQFVNFSCLITELHWRKAQSLLYVLAQNSVFKIISVAQILRSMALILNFVDNVHLL